MKLVSPKVFLIGVTGILDGLEEYLKYSGNEEFLKDVEKAKKDGLSDGEILCSFYAKLCYKSLTLGKNENISKIRDIESNLMGCFNSGHHSVVEHCYLNFIITDCSRIFCNELIRHRVGSSVSQTSGRYVSSSEIDFIHDPILDDVLPEIKECLEHIEGTVKKIKDKMLSQDMPFSQKKKITSAIRRIAPNGQGNEIGFSMNIRTLRHILKLRTSTHAEWEIRMVSCQIADIIFNKWPLMLYNMEKRDTNDGLYELV